MRGAAPHQRSRNAGERNLVITWSHYERCRDTGTCKYVVTPVCFRTGCNSKRIKDSGEARKHKGSATSLIEAGSAAGVVAKWVYLGVYMMKSGDGRYRSNPVFRPEDLLPDRQDREFKRGWQAFGTQYPFFLQRCHWRARLWKVIGKFAGIPCGPKWDWPCGPAAYADSANPLNGCSHPDTPQDRYQRI